MLSQSNRMANKTIQGNQFTAIFDSRIIILMKKYYLGKTIVISLAIAALPTQSAFLLNIKRACTSF